MGKIKIEKFSYSKLNTYNSCGWKYKLTYQDGHYIFSDSLASELGTTLHYIEEQIAKALKAHEQVNYEQLKQDFKTLNIPKTSPFDTNGGVFGIDILKKKYKDDFYTVNKNGQSYYTKTLDYLSYGIYRLEEFLKQNPNLEIYDMEKYFSIEFEGHVLSGYIDRIFYDHETGEYYVEDIKTKDHLFSPEEVTTPLQFVIYVYALSQILDIPVEKFHCAYDLPFCGVKQDAGTKGFMSRGIKKLQKIFTAINEKDFKPNPTPLCHWCQFCPTNPNQPLEGKNLCPYYSLWTRENKTREVANQWEGIDKHKGIMQQELKKQQEKEHIQILKEFDFDF